jgi:hypothetical protein
MAVASEAIAAGACSSTRCDRAGGESIVAPDFFVTLFFGLHAKIRDVVGTRGGGSHSHAGIHRSAIGDDRQEA